MDTSGKKQRLADADQKPLITSKENQVVADEQVVNVSSCVKSKRKGELYKKLKPKVHWNDQVRRELAHVIQEEDT